MNGAFKLRHTWAPLFGALMVSGLLASGQGVPSGTAEKKPLRIRVSQEVVKGNLTKKIEPSYPEAAKAAGVDGQVVLVILIGEDGTIQKLKPTSGHPLLVSAAMDAVRQWIYKPYLLNGQPIEVETTITVSFQLQPTRSTSRARGSAPSNIGGSIVGEVYRNDFFRFTFELPKGWFFQETPQSQPKNRAAQFEYHVLAQAVPRDRGFWSSVLTLEAQKTSAPTGREYVRILRAPLGEAPWHPEPTGGPEQFSLSGREFFRVDCSLMTPAQGQTVTIYQSRIVTAERGYAFGLYLTAKTKNDLNKLVEESLQRMQFVTPSRSPN